MRLVGFVKKTSINILTFFSIYAYTGGLERIIPLYLSVSYLIEKKC